MKTIDWPFRAGEALDAGALTFRQLRRFHFAIYPGVWAPRGVDPTIVDRARAAWLWSRRSGVVAGLSASALLGSQWVEPAMPAELVHANRLPPQGIIVHTDALAAGETQLVRGMPVTTPARTAFDLGRRLPLMQGVARIDALVNATDVKVEAIETVVAGHPGVRGLEQLRETLALVDGGAESPYESMTRLVLIQAGFPRPETQIRVLDEYGFVVARVDMGWRRYLVGVEFEGAHHWTDPGQRDRDVERYAKLPELGWTTLRVTSGTLYQQRRVFLERAGTALTAAGCPKTW